MPRPDSGGVTANKLTMCGIQISIDTPKPGHIASNKGATKLTLSILSGVLRCSSDSTFKINQTERHS
jgi:hypothetical protein